MNKPPCPFCNSNDAELFSLYGQTLLGSQYYCNHCRSIFEAVRFDEEEYEPENKEKEEEPEKRV